MFLRFLTLAIFMFTYAIGLAQPKITSPEVYAIGEKYEFAKCESKDLDLNTTGANHSWDFSNLTSLLDTFSINIINPDATDYTLSGKDISYIEEGSDGSYVFASITEDRCYLHQYIIKDPFILISYKKPQVYLAKPITYLDSVNDTYRTNYNASGYAFKGTGTTEIIADGYGTLNLPNGNYDNVLRIKITQKQTDTLIQFNSIVKSNTITYLWFKEGLNAPLLRAYISSSSQGETTEVSYLLIDRLNDINEVKTNSHMVVNNPFSEFLTINTTRRIQHAVLTSLSSVSYSIKIDRNGYVFTGAIPAGIYVLTIAYKDGIIEHKKVMKL